MQEIIAILIGATISVVGIAILFWIVRLCQILSTSQTNRENEINRLTRETGTLTQENTRLNQQITNLNEANRIMLQMNETNDQQIRDLTTAITQLQEEINNIPFTYIRITWPVPNATPEETEELRAMSYEQFLGTSHWRNRARAMMSYAGGRCQTCNASPSEDNPLEVHHRHYRTVGNERPIDLVALCRQCHQLIHENRPIDGRQIRIRNNNGDC